MTPPSSKASLVERCDSRALEHSLKVFSSSGCGYSLSTKKAMAQKMCGRLKSWPIYYLRRRSLQRYIAILNSRCSNKLLKDCSGLHPKRQLPQSYLYYGPGHTISELSHTSDWFEQVENRWLSSSYNLTIQPVL